MNGNSALPELKSLCTHLCAFIYENLLGFVAVPGASGPYVKAIIRRNPLASPFLFFHITSLQSE